MCINYANGWSLVKQDLDVEHIEKECTFNIFNAHPWYIKL